MSPTGVNGEDIGFSEEKARLFKEKRNQSKDAAEWKT